MTISAIGSRQAARPCRTQSSGWGMGEVSRSVLRSTGRPLAVQRVLAKTSEAETVGGTGELVQMVAPAPTPPLPPSPGIFNTSPSTIAIIALQAVGLVGATVTGTLARRRRIEMEKINTQLREINSKLRSQQSMDEQILSAEEMRAIQQYRLSPQSGFGAQSAANQTSEDSQMSDQRQQLLADIQSGRDLLDQRRFPEALEVLQAALLVSRDLEVLPATRAIMRLKARAYKEMGKYEDSLRCLEKVLLVSIAMEEYSIDADVCGDIADMYTQIGDLEQAAEYYDRYLSAISSGLPTNLSSTWDMA